MCGIKEVFMSDFKEKVELFLLPKVVKDSSDSFMRNGKCSPRGPKKKVGHWLARVMC